jgi:hypothetical protein
MTLLKEGDGVNFQKASCTLDGCVKIYTSRVDSVATETGKLLSGLADSGNKKRKGDGENEDGEDGEDDEDGEEGEDGAKKRSKKRVRSHVIPGSLLTKSCQGATVFRSHSCAFVCPTSAEEVRVGVFG